jgi:hypothetical protein
MAELVKMRVELRGGREGTLSTIGSVLVYLGFAVGIVLAFVGMVSGQNTAASVIGGIFLALNGVVANAILQSFAEVIRLLKKQIGMDYGGSISLAYPVYRYICSKCGRNQPLSNIFLRQINSHVIVRQLRFFETAPFSHQAVIREVGIFFVCNDFKRNSPEGSIRQSSDVRLPCSEPIVEVRANKPHYLGAFMLAPNIRHQIETRIFSRS